MSNEKRASAFLARSDIFLSAHSRLIEKDERCSTHCLKSAKSCPLGGGEKLCGGWNVSGGGAIGQWQHMIGVNVAGGMLWR